MPIGFKQNPLGFLNPIGNLDFLQDNYLVSDSLSVSETNSCRKSFFPKRNLIPI